MTSLDTELDELDEPKPADTELTVTLYANGHPARQADTLRALADVYERHHTEVAERLPWDHYSPDLRNELKKLARVFDPAVIAEAAAVLVDHLAEHGRD